MRTITLIKAPFICFCFFLSSCSNKSESTLNSLTPIVNKEHKVSLKKPVYLSHKEIYNLHWDSDLPEHKIAYNLSVNGKLIKRNLTKTVISENENVIEFNVPVTDYSISNKQLKKGVNTLQIIAEYNGTEVLQSNKIEIINDTSNYLASK